MAGQIFYPNGTTGTANTLDGFGIEHATSRRLVSYYKDIVYAASRKNADKITQTALRLYRRGSSGTLNRALRKHLTAKAIVSGRDDVSEVTDHKALSLLRMPNPNMYGHQFLTYVCLYLEVVGNVWIYVEPNTMGLWILPPHLTTVVYDRAGNVTGFTWNGQPLDPANVLHLAEPNLEYPYSQFGVSAVSSIFDSLKLQEQITAALNNIMQNEGRPSGLLTPKGEFNMLDEDGAERWRTRYLQHIKAGSGGIMVADNDATFTPLQWSPNDMSIAPIIDIYIRKAAMAHRIPVMILKGEGINVRAAYQAAIAEWCETGISSKLRNLEDFYNYRYLPLFNEPDLFFAFDDPSPHIMELEATVNTQYVNAGILRPNEVRAALGYDPVPEGDVLRGPSISSELAGAMAGNTGESETQEADNRAEQAEDKDETDNETKALREQVATLQKALLTKTVVKAAGGRKIPVVKELAAVTRKHLKKWREAMLRALKRNKGGIAKALPANFKPLKSWGDAFAKDAVPYVMMNYKKAGEQLLSDVGASLDKLRVFNPKVKEYAQERSYEFAQSTLDSVTGDVNKALDDIKDAIAEGLDSGDATDDLADRIQEIFDGLSDSRAELIATTESARAFHEGLRQGAKTSGVVDSFEHLTTDAPCPICEALNGHIYQLDDDLPPDNTHPGCLCELIEVLTDGETTNEDDGEAE